MLKQAALTFGVGFIAIGILGFVPTLAPGGHLLGIFHVNAVHNWIHIASGIVALVCAITSLEACRAYFQIFGAIYGLVAILGLFTGNAPIFGLIANNLADVVLHLAIAGSALYLGFGYARARAGAHAGW